MKIRKVLFIGTSNAGVQYWRMFNWSAASYRTGVGQFQILGWERDLNEAAPWQGQINDPQFQKQLIGMLNPAWHQADVVIVQAVHTFQALQTIWTFKDEYKHIPVLMEIDDDITDVPSYNQASTAYFAGSLMSRLQLQQLKHSDGVIVSTPHLKEIYADYNPHIHVMPNSIDFSKWDKVKVKKKEGIRIGWSGGTSHLEDLRIIEPVVHRILERNKDARFVFLSNDFPEFFLNIPKVYCIKKWVKITQYPQLLANQDFDIAMAPLLDNRFNRAKSNLRWLESSALGIPCVASNVGHFKQTITNGKDGFLANDEKDFENYLQLLIDDKKLRKAVGREAKRKVEVDFNVDRNVKKYAQVVEEVIERGPWNKSPSIMTGVEDDNPAFSGALQPIDDRIKPEDIPYEVLQ